MSAADDHCVRLVKHCPSKRGRSVLYVHTTLNTLIYLENWLSQSRTESNQEIMLNVHSSPYVRIQEGAYLCSVVCPSDNSDRNSVDSTSYVPTVRPCGLARFSRRSVNLVRP